MATPATPADFLELQNTVSAPITNGYTCLRGTQAATQRTIQFLTTAIAPGYGPFPEGSRFPIPVSVDTSLFFNDTGYPPAGAAPVGPIQIQRRGPAAPAGTYLASDGTVLTTQGSSETQISGFSGKSKDGHNYALSVTATVESAAGRVANSTPSWLFARCSITKDLDTPLVFGFGYCASDNLMNVFIERGSISTAIQIDYSQASPQNGTAKLTRSLTYYGDSFMSEVATMSANVTDPGMYLPVDVLWPFLDRVTFFEPALEAIASQTAGDLPKIAPPLTPVVAIGSIGFGESAPQSLSQMTFVQDATGTVGPALGPLAASVIKQSFFLGTALQSAAQWLGWYVVGGDGKASLATELTADYNAWVTWFNENQRSGSLHGGVPIYYPNDPKGGMISYHPDPWA